MTETMTPQEAAMALAEASRYEDALAERTAGLTWMVWGIVTPGIFLTYAFAGVLSEGAWWFGLLWMPWVAMGIVTTVMMWRSAALSAPALDTKATPAFWARFFGFTAAITLLMYVVQPHGPEVPLIIVGGMWAGMGVVNLWGASTFGRIVSVAAGLPLVVAGATLAAIGAPIAASGMVGLFVSGLAPFVAGLYQTLRG